MSELKIFPLGGLESIGLNCTVIQYGKRFVLIDCGIGFPDSLGAQIGIEFYTPSFDYVLQNASGFLGLVFTHGHEDHIGAAPFLLQKLMKTRLFARPFSRRLVESKLERNAIRPEDVNMTTLELFRPVKLGPFSIQAFPVDHSIPEASGLVIDTPVGRIVHSGDFRHVPLQFRLPDGTRKSARAFFDKPLLLMSDSTNSTREGNCKGEKDIVATLTDTFKRAPGRIFFTTFSSNLERIKNILQISHRQGRHVHVIGQSFLRNLVAAYETEVLRKKENLIIENLSDFQALPEERQVIIATGCQGESRAAMTRIVHGHHRQLCLHDGDTVLFSARIIPGNEKTVYDLVNAVMKTGANAVYPSIADIHVSGHGYREDQLRLLDLVRPFYFMPVHGEYRHLKHHADLAATQLPRERVFPLLPGEGLSIDSSQTVSRFSAPKSAQVAYDGRGDQPMSDSLIRDRKTLAKCGMVTCVLLWDRRLKAYRRDLALEMYATSIGSDHREVGQMRSKIETALFLMNDDALDLDGLSLVEYVQRLIRREMNRVTGWKPKVQVMTVEV